MARFDHSQRVGVIAPDTQIRPCLVQSPAPGIAKPERREEVEWRRRRSAVRDRRADQHVVLSRLGVFDRDVEKAVLTQHVGVPEFELRLHLRALGIAPHQFLVRKRRLRITISHPHVRMRGRVVLEEKNLLHIFAVIPLRTGQAEEPLLQNRIALVPEGEGETEALLEIGDAANPILAPAIGARAGMLVREIIPGVAVRAVILAHRAPLSLAQIRAPQVPAPLAMVILLEALLFRVHRADDDSFRRMEIFRKPGKIALVTIEDVTRFREPVKLLRINHQFGRHA